MKLLEVAPDFITVPLPMDCITVFYVSLRQKCCTHWELVSSGGGRMEAAVLFGSVKQCDS